MILQIHSPKERLSLIRETIDLQESTCWKAQEDIAEVLNNYTYKKHVFNFKIESLVRATVNSDADWFNSIEKLSYPPKGVLKRFGRCNFPNEPIFYCSNENGVPVFEVKPEVNQYIVLSVWFDQSRQNSVLFLGMPLRVEAIIRSLRKNSDFIDVLKQDDVFKESTDSNVVEIDRYIANLFTESTSKDEDRLYWLTSATTKMYLNQKFSDGSKLDGLIYPSVASQITGYNVVLKTDFVDKNIRLKGASMYKLVEHDEEKKKYVLAPIKTLMRLDSNGFLEWQDISQRHTGKYYVLSPETPTVPFDEAMILNREE